MSRRPSSSSSNSNSFYDLLGVNKDSAQTEIRKAYLKLANKYHPDKNQGNEEAAEMFKQVQKAYEVLSNEQKKSIYDQYGEEGLENGGPGMSGGMADFMSQFFGGGGGASNNRTRAQERKSSDIKYELTVTLEDVYNGKNKKLRIKRTVQCPTCNGKGGTKEGAVKQCLTCNGRGIRMITRQLGPGMITQTQSVCSACSGEGEVIDEKFKCTNCYAKKVVEIAEVVEVNIDKGMTAGQRLTFYGKGEQAPGLPAGDLYIFIKEDKSPSKSIFTRYEENHLICEQSINLSQALTGFEIHIKHMDGRILIIQSNPGEIIKPGDVKRIRGEGMPRFRAPQEKGDLLIKFNIVFPECLNEDVTQKIAQLLPPKPTLMEIEPNSEIEVDHYKIESFNIDEYKSRRQSSRSEAYEEEEEEGGSQRTCMTH
eukprot:TRINITY_DN201_c2_g1_i1.p1 TRINITY_DN201_c2_g1~~TRINITY_DN201_c2_g1_i1.p1  ORF type:complete len:424 (+),score=236.42 TRINITY_DN201_c2_g1_i1:174-1445(+)